ncbi:MAG: InlB B-repeat-containing protein [Eubacteriaceae bacterium]|nr:InlB B-repeat-containing protein [Eubacteriaceae bacterium]
MLKKIKTIIAMICCAAMIITFIPVMGSVYADEEDQGTVQTQTQAQTGSKTEKAAATKAASYTVQFEDWDGSVLKTETVSEGDSATPPADPSRKGYEFKGWDGNFASVKGDMTIRAKYTTKHIYRVEVNYILKDTNAPAADPYIVEIPYGTDWDAVSPQVTGYKLEDQAQSTVSGSINESSSTRQSIDVYYVPDTDIQYKVEHYQEGLDGKYTKVDEETKSAPGNSTVTAEKKSYEGFECITKDLSAKITADSETVIKIYYDRETYGIYFTTKGTYYPTVYAKYGEDVSAEIAAVLGETPEREGYTFTDWTGDTGATVMPARDLHINAEYEGKAANYRVVHWVQKADLTGYDYYSSEEMSGLSDTQVQFNIKTDIKHFEYSTTNTKNQTEAAKIINGNGNTVVNLYYDRKTYKVIYKIAAYGTQPLTEYKTISAPYGSAIEVPSVDGVKAKFYEMQGITDPTAAGTPKFYLWLNPDAGLYWINQPATMPDPSNETGGYTELRATFSTGAFYDFSYRRYCQELDGTYSAVPTRKTDFAFGTNNLHLSNNLTGFTLSEYRYTPFGSLDETTFGEWKPATDATVVYDYGITETRYTRNSYTVDFISEDTKVKTDTKQYEEAVDATEDGDDYFIPTNKPEGDYVFAGWYEDDNYTKKATATKMPADNKIYYAKWMPPYYTVTFDAAGGSDIDEQQIVKGKALDSTVTNTVRPGYTFLGWYYESGKRYDMDAPVNRNTKLTAKWKAADNIKYTIKHVMKSTGEVLYQEEGTGSMDEVIDAQSLAPGDDDYPAQSVIADVASKSMNLSVDESKNVITFYYSPFTETSYTVNYIAVDMEGNETKMETKNVKTQSIVVTERAKSFDGYVPAVYYIKQVLGSDESTNVINFYYTTNAAAKYTIEHYKVALDGTVTLADKEVKYGPVGATVTAAEKTYEGYSFDSRRSEDTMTGMVRTASDSRGELILEMFYNEESEAIPLITEEPKAKTKEKTVTKKTKPATGSTASVKTANSVKTGDTSDMAPFIIIMMLAAAGGAVVLAGKKGKRKNK